MIDVCDISQIKDLLQRHGFRFSKAKGQNFLTQAWVPERIALESGLDKTAGVLEIGPGIGPLTRQLCAHAAKVVAIEVDTALKPVLAETMAGYDNLELVFDNAMKLDLKALCQSRFAGLRPMACANLPYYITSPVLTMLLESRAFDQATVMIQKEVAQRICAAPGTGEYSAFTVFCNYYARPRMLFDVPPSCFIPQPKVTSTVIALPTRAQPPCPVRDEALFFRVVRAGFAMRRKTLTNGLCAAFPQVGKERIAGLLAGCGIDPATRAERLDIPAFAAIPVQ